LFTHNFLEKKGKKKEMETEKLIEEKGGRREESKGS